MFLASSYVETKLEKKMKWMYVTNRVSGSVEVIMILKDWGNTLKYYKVEPVHTHGINLGFHLYLTRTSNEFVWWSIGL